MEFDKNEILQNTAKYINTLSKGLNTVDLIPFHTIEFASVEFRNIESLKPILKEKVKKYNPLIYTIELIDITVLPQILKNFEEFSAKNKERTKNVDRVNVSRYNKTHSKYLYVGICTSSDFYTRIENHLGTRKNRVYSMHLSKWDRDLDYNIKLMTYKISSFNKKKVDRILVELIEQQIWDKLQPVFGKRSGL
ncbi:hypothetical protein [Allomuricauda sp. NBRC 101325]|uniref:hypothetical protein n=1 Tax=Allomuricauda sp. NBRC 101325 TaxID=1113758 RepID=UPI0024A41399|nr:hypothetical protein [Muricauda sp. NBRC 101325]GLU45402.1 hypothetical protein Musp01_30260 [Muricauda sp. NBRC 101325]